MLGSLLSYRMSGISIKLRQAELAKALANSMITWTFDPFESCNVYLNIHKLKTVGAMYKANYYGLIEDEINQGLPSR